MRKAIAFAGAVLALAAMGYAAAWFQGANRMERAIADWKDETEAKGFSRAGNASATPGTVSVMETVSTSKSAISFS